MNYYLLLSFAASFAATFFALGKPRSFITHLALLVLLLILFAGFSIEAIALVLAGYFAAVFVRVELNKKKLPAKRRKKSSR
jgi:hypothetical protein